MKAAEGLFWCLGFAALIVALAYAGKSCDWSDGTCKEEVISVVHAPVARCSHHAARMVKAGEVWRCECPGR